MYDRFEIIDPDSQELVGISPVNSDGSEAGSSNSPEDWLSDRTQPFASSPSPKRNTRPLINIPLVSPRSTDDSSSESDFSSGDPYVAIGMPEAEEPNVVFDFSKVPVPKWTYELTRVDYNVWKFGIDICKYIFVALILILPYYFFLRPIALETDYLKLTDAFVTTSFPPTLLGIANSIERRYSKKSIKRWEKQVVIQEPVDVAAINEADESTPLLPKDKLQKCGDFIGAKLRALLAMISCACLCHILFDLDLIPSFSGAGVAAVLATLELQFDIPVDDFVNLFLPLLTTLAVVTRNYRAVGDKREYRRFKDVHEEYDKATNPVFRI